MITSNLDVLNLNASKPSLNKKADLSFNNSQANGFGDELASFQAAINGGNEETLSENISLAAAALPNMKAPNQVSEENVKTLTENLNNFSALQTSLPEFNENLVKDLGQEEEVLAGMNDEEAAKMALQALAATPLLANAQTTSASNQTNTNQLATESAPQNVALSSPMLNAQNLNPGYPQINPQVKLQINPQENQQTGQQNSVMNSPLAAPEMELQNPALGGEQEVAVADAKVFSKSEKSVGPNKDGKDGKFSLEGFQAVTPQAVTPELAAAVKQNLNQTNQGNFTAPAPMAAIENSVSEKSIASEVSDTGLSASKTKAANVAVSPSAAEALSFLQNLAPQTETQAAVVAESATPMGFAAAVGMSPQNQSKNESGDSKNFSSDSSSGVSSKDKEKKVEVTGTEQSFAHMAEKHKVGEAQLKTAEAAVALPTEAQHKNNLDQIVTHARTFLKDGGGEMVMKLTPEGLGTVDLKVAVKDGQVSIEINTQNEHVKKMFEEGAKDLRGALEVQNLKVDTLKVNMADHVQKDMNMNQFNMSDKDFARNFMGQFRDERQGFRNQSLNGVMDKFHAPSKEAGGLRPAGLAMGNSSRLNVVA